MVVFKRQSERKLPSFLLLAVLTGGLLVSVVLSIGFGSVDIPPGEVASVLWSRVLDLLHLKEAPEQSFQSSTAIIILKIRLPRVLMAAVIGAGLAVSGTVMQAVVRNPLADPYILGISSGSSVGAAAAILLGAFSVFGNYGISVGAFLGALAASVFVFAVAFSGKGSGSTVKLLLAGMAVSAIGSSFTSFMVYTANDAEGIRDVSFWTMGSLASASWDMLPVPVVAAVLICGFFLTQFRILDVMLLGTESAATLGVNILRFRRLYMVLTACLTGIMVATVGTVGFVGLIIPHVARMFTGSDHRRLTPAAALGGAIFLIWCDVFARIFLNNVELPIGVVTGILGGPFFVYLMLTKSYGFGGE